MCSILHKNLPTVCHTVQLPIYTKLCEYLSAYIYTAYLTSLFSISLFDHFQGESPGETQLLQEGSEEADEYSGLCWTAWLSYHSFNLTCSDPCPSMEQWVDILQLNRTVGADTFSCSSCCWLHQSLSALSSLWWYYLELLETDRVGKEG